MAGRAGCYRTSARAFSISECWRVGGPRLFHVFLAAKYFGRVVPANHVSSGEFRRVPSPTGPSPLLETHEAVGLQAARAGFRPLFHYRSAEVSGFEGMAQAFLGSDRRVLGLAIGSLSSPDTGSVTEVGFACLSRFPDETWRGTSSARRRFDAPAWMRSTHHPGASASALLQAHSRKLESKRHGRALAFDEADVPAVLQRHLERIQDWLLARGLYEPCPEHRDPTP